MMNQKLLMHSLCLFTLALLGPNAASAQDYEARSRRIDSLFARYGPETPGVSVRVIERGQVVHRGDYGMADLENHVPITASTVFAIGSNSKQFTGLAVVMLAEQGKIDLDADVRTYVPGMPDFGKTITVRQLLHHTSGLRDWVRPFFMAGWMGASITYRQVMDFLKRQQTLNFAPGERYMYSNTGYTLLAEVVSSVTETPFPDWMREHIFEPLGMTHTRVRANWYDLVEDYAHSYYPRGDGYISVYNGLAAYGSCCILSTTDDMTKWLRNYVTAEVGGRAPIRQMVQDTVGINEWDGRLVGYGYGLMHFQWQGHKGLFHSGQWVGFRSATLHVPALELSIVVLGNTGQSTNLREWDILEMYAGTEETVAQADPNEAEPAHSLDDLAVSVDPEVLDGYVGTYDFRSQDDGSSQVLTVTRADDRLIIKFTTDREPSTWTPTSRTEFMGSVDGPTLAFEVSDSGPATAVTWRGRTHPRVEAFSPTPRELEDFAGTFYSDELDTTWRFEVMDGVGLVANQIRWGGTLSFIPTVRDEFRGSTQITQARFVRNAAGDVTELLVSGRRALRIRFVKLDGVSLVGS